MKLNSKRLISAILALCMIACALPSLAADPEQELDASVEVVGDQIIGALRCLDEGEGTIMTVYVTDDGNMPDFLKGNIVAFDAFAVNAGQRAADFNGFIITFGLKMPETAPTGTYTVYMGASFASGYLYGDIDYLGKADRNSFMDVINAPDVTPEDVVAKLAAMPEPLTLDSLRVDSGVYNKLPAAGKLRYAEILLNKDAQYKEDHNLPLLEFEDLTGLSGGALIVAALDSSFETKSNYKETYDVIKENSLAQFGIDPETDDRFARVTSGENLVKAIKANHPEEFNSVEEIGEVIPTALYLAALNETPYRSRIDFIKSNNVAFFRLPTADINDILSNKKLVDYYHSALNEMLPVYTKDDFDKVWAKLPDEAQKAYDKDHKSSGGSGGGSGSSGGSGGSGSSKKNKNPTLTVNPGLVRDDPLDKKLLITEYYDDVADYAWAHVAILDLTQNGVISGTGNNKFEPARTLKREEFMKLLVNAFGLADMKATSSFSDVSDPNAWYYMYIASAEKAGITSGRGDGTFGIGDDVTREEMAALIYRAALKANARLTAPTAAITPYSDINEVSPYAVDAVRILAASGVISATNGVFGPKEGTSRAQAAVAIYSIRNLI